MSEKMHRFKVVGCGQFPIDMLRYDGCWPSTQQDASAIERSFRKGEAAIIELEGIYPETSDRWASFGWNID